MDLFPKTTFLFWIFAFFIQLSDSRAAILPYAPDEILPQFETFFARKGIGPDYSPFSLDKLFSLSRNLHQETANLLMAENFGDMGKGWMERKEKFLSYLEENLQNTRENADLSSEEKAFQFYQGKQILYMLAAEEKVEKLDTLASTVRTDPFSKKVEVALRYLKKRKIFHVDIPSLHRPLGKAGAEREASFLLSPGGHSPKMLTAREMAALTPLEVARLDIAGNHPMWRTREDLKNRGGQDPWNDLENRINQKMTLFLDKKHSFGPRFPTFSYDLTQHHRILFFDEIKASGTAPKINAKDPFGVRWKVKWSAEIQPEVVANRLLIHLGAKYVDPVYSTALGGKGLTLILKETPAQFQQLMKKSKYRMDIGKFFHKTGIITAENLGEVFKHWPPEAPKKSPSQFIGHHYITFREAQVEFSPKDVILRGGPTSWTRFEARKDRVARGLLLYNSWINNIDPNEENNKAYLLPLQKENELVYGQHDLGYSMTALFGAGHLNTFSSGGFISKHSSSIGFSYFLFYLPGAWQRTSYADLLWMGEKIVPIPRKKIEDIVSHTQWPDFMQMALVYKLLMRRNLVASILGLQHLLPKGEGPLVAPSLSVPVGTPAERRRTAFQYGLDPEVVEKAYRGRRLNPGYVEKILKEGRVTACESSPLIRLLHFHRHPTGLDRRLLGTQGIPRFLLTRNCGGIPRVRWDKKIK